MTKEKRYSKIIKFFKIKSAHYFILNGAFLVESIINFTELKILMGIFAISLAILSNIMGRKLYITEMKEYNETKKD